MSALRQTHWAVAVFCALFGLLFVIFGIRRMLGARSGNDVVGSILWGSVGIASGLAFFFGAYWIASPAVSQ